MGNADVSGGDLGKRIYDLGIMIFDCVWGEGLEEVQQREQENPD
jgi:hypothetical protein